MSLRTPLKPELKKDDQPKSWCASFWQDNKLQRRLNITGIITSITDNVLDLIAVRSDTFSDFLANKVPYYITFLFYLIPTVIPYLPNVINGCKIIPQEPDEILKELEELADMLNEDIDIELVLEKHKKLKIKFLQKVAEYEKKKNHETINLILSVTYLILRTVIQGTITLLKGTENASTETNENVIYTLQLINDILSIIYDCVMLLNYYHSRKKPVKKENVPAPETKEEKKIDPLPSPPLPSPTLPSLTRPTI